MEESARVDVQTEKLFRAVVPTPIPPLSANTELQDARDTYLGEQNVQDELARNMKAITARQENKGAHSLLDEQFRQFAEYGNPCHTFLLARDRRLGSYFRTNFRARFRGAGASPSRFAEKYS